MLLFFVFKFEKDLEVKDKRYQPSIVIFQLLSEISSAAIKGSQAGIFTTSKISSLDVLLEAPPLVTTGSFFSFFFRALVLMLASTELQFIVYQSKVLGDTIKKMEIITRKKKLDESISKVTTLLVDKICQGLFPTGRRVLFNFLITLLQKNEEQISALQYPVDISRFLKTKAPQISTEITTVFRSLNRLIVFFLSSPTCTGKTSFFIYFLHR